MGFPWRTALTDEYVALRLRNDAVDNAIKRTVHRAPWQQGLHAFARRVKTILRKNQAANSIRAEQCRDYVDRWHSALVIDDAVSFEAVWATWCEVFDRAEHANDEGAFAAAVRATADKSSWPGLSDDARADRLLALFRELARMNKEAGQGAVFFCSLRTADEVSGINYRTVGRLMTQWAREGILRQVKAGTAKRAPRWKWLKRVR